LLIDATPFEGQQMVAALGIGLDGRKTILGIRQGATENATVVSELLDDLVSRGLDFAEPRLYILDGAKALSAAVKKHAGESAAIQRCQVHIAGRVPRFPEGWNVPSRASPCEPGSLGSGMVG
jgi:putative transposase